MTIARMMITKRFALMLMAWVAITVLTLGVAASCPKSEGGMWQGGSDSEPGWRR